ncbi:MAG TPA: esterase-like activity of phytase family protein, partial [Polyangiaceae bacterium]|nr:esterase-like activity of phytase family protein [Polyangiaceae bacterium]
DRRGRVAFYAADELRYLGAVAVGFVPDMLTFTPDGRRVLVANEGEQVRDADDRIMADPEGSVSIIDLRAGVAAAQVSHARFERFDARVDEYRRAGVRIARLGDRFFESGAGAVRLSRDLEPEYIAVAADGKRAWVSLQENDAVALLDIESASFVEIFPLGLKDFSRGQPSLDRISLSAPAAGANEVAASDAAASAAAAGGLWFDPGESRGDQEVLYLLRGAAIERHVLEGGRATCTAVVELEPGLASGAGLRGLARDARDGAFWVGDAARAVVYRVAADGRLQHRLELPSAARSGVAALALDPSAQRVLAFLEPPLASATDAPPWARLVVIDAEPRRASFGARLAEYLYPRGEAGGEASVRVVAATLAEPERLLVAERGPDGADAVFHIDLAGAGDLRAVERGPLPLDDGTLRELLDGGALQPVHKRALVRVANAEAPGAVAGLALLGAGRLALLGAPGLQLWPGQVGGAPARGSEAARPLLGVVRFDGQLGLDASDRDGAVRLSRWPVLGAYMPDGIAALHVGGEEYFITANEGDTRGYDARRLRDLELDPARFPDAAALQSSANLGRLKVSLLDGDLDGDGDLDEVHAFGARSVSLWDRSGRLVFDTGSLLEEVTATALADAFNSNNAANASFDTRSDDRGPEPEGLAVAAIGGRTYAFVGLERVGGIVILDVTDPSEVRFVEYDNLRDFSVDVERGAALDLGPEGLKFVPPASSPTGRGLLLVANEVSGTTTAYDVNL